MADEDDNDLLSPEEREILADPEYGKAEDAADVAADDVKSKERTIPLDEIDEDGDPIVSDGEDAPPPDTPAEIAAPAPEKDDPAPAEDATLAAAQKAYEAASAAAKAVPEFSAEDKSRVDAIKTESEALLAKFDDGEMTAAEFREATRKLEAEDRALEKKADRWQSAKDSLAAAEKDYGSAEDAAWDTAAAEWKKAHPEVEAAGADAFAKFDAVLRSFTASDLSDGLTFKQMMDQALALFAGRNPGLIKTVAPAKGVHPADAARKAAETAAVPTLAGMPAAALTDAGEGEFAALDALANSSDPTVLEDALERLYKKDPAAHARYMAL